MTVLWLLHMKKHDPPIFYYSLANRFRELVVKNELYLEPTIRLDDIAFQLKVNRVYLSQAINRCLEKNFLTYINELRVAKAIELMKKEKGDNLLIENIAFLSGFNDRKSFCRVFKRITGHPPSDYRKLTEQHNIL